MAEFDGRRRDLAEAYRVANALENILTPQQARLFVRSIQNGWGVQPLNWTIEQSHKLFDQARLLLHAARVFEEVDGQGTDAATSCYRRAAEILEWLSTSRDAVAQEVPTAMLAAGAYQLAGFPAMASGLLRNVVVEGAAGVMRAFLACELGDVLEGSAEFWRVNIELTGRDGSNALLRAAPDTATASDEGGDGTAHSQIARYVVAETIRALGLLAEGLRRGEVPRVDMALKKLGATTEVAGRWSNDDTWTLLTLLHATAVRFASNSLHRRALPLAGGSPSSVERLRRFSREQFRRGRGVLWPSQLRGLERLVSDRAFALCTPTGSGKTLVANLALVKELLMREPIQGQPAPLAVYLVPSRALAGEVEAKLGAEFRDENIIVTGLYGGTDWGITDNWLTSDTPTVLVATVEKAEALMRYLGPLLLTRLELLIIDEAHQIVVNGDERTRKDLAAHSERAIRLESLVSRLITLKPQLARIALTAVAGGAAAPISRWIEQNEDALPVGLGYRSSRQLVGALECAPGRAPRVILELNNGQRLYVRGREDPVYLTLTLPPMPRPPAGVTYSLHHYVQIHALWTALHLAPSGRRVLISVTQSPDRVMKRYADAFGYKGWVDLPPFVPPAGEAEAMYKEARECCVDYCGEMSSEVRLLDRGIATSHGQMPQRLRRLMVRLIDRQICKITVATATLTEGVNLPFDLIIIPSLERMVGQQANGAPITDIISTAEFRNLAGRAGRPGAAEMMEGMTLVCLPVENSTNASSYQSTQDTQRGAYLGALDRMLRLLAVDESSTARVHAPLQTLLASIWTILRDSYGMRTAEQLHGFLEQALPETIGANLGAASSLPSDMLGDSIDELDGLILAAVDELERLEGLPPEALEEAIRRLWQQTFTKYATAVEGWMEAAFIKRGTAVVQTLYPNAEQRRKLYQFGYTPFVGRQFQVVSPSIQAILKTATGYGRQTPEERFALFWQLGELVRPGRGFGYSVKKAADQALIDRWHLVAGWWLKRPGAPPPAIADLRRWQTFVADNLEFRLGVAVGAAVAEAWNAGSPDGSVPSLDGWRETSGLPWAAFWFRELLRWGTTDPFVAFAMSQGLAGTRDGASALRAEFEVWLTQNLPGASVEDWIDPRLFLKWSRSLAPRVAPEARVTSVSASFEDGNGTLPQYAVRPLEVENGFLWLDPAGYRIARSSLRPGSSDDKMSLGDFELVNDQFGPRVVQTY